MPLISEKIIRMAARCNYCNKSTTIEAQTKKGCIEGLESAGWIISKDSVFCSKTCRGWNARQTKEGR